MNNKFPTKALILDVPICGISLKEFVDTAINAVLNQKKTIFTTINTYSIVEAQKNKEFLNHFKTADFVLPDGIGIVWAIRRLGKECKERVSGPEFTNALLAQANVHEFSFYFLGSTQDVLEKIVRNVKEKYPTIKIAGYHAPPFSELADMNHKGIVEKINKSGADILLVGMTAPKQELFLSRNYTNINVPFMMGIGAPLVPTSVFYDKEEALAWAKNTTYPKVFKLRGGAGAANVRLAKNKKEAVRLIRTDIIKEIGLLDEKTFLYLEELILHEKLRVLNKSTYIVPQSKIVHKGGKTTNIIPSSFIMQTLQESRQYYFRSYRHFSAWFLYSQKFLNNIYFFMKLLKKTIETKLQNNL